MFDHVTIRCGDRRGSEAFYDTVLAPLGVGRLATGVNFTEWGEFSVAQAEPAHPGTAGLHIGFAAASREPVDEFWRAGTAAGHRSDGEPGPRPQYVPDYYGAFLIDPDGNSAEACHHGHMAGGAVIDHLWIRVADIEAARRFYEDVAPHAGFRPAERGPEHARFTGAHASVTLVADPVASRHVHMAFTAADNAAVDAFHAALVGAGYRDNGPPGERRYHPGYYGAFVLDPDGNNIELVCHNR